ncbi:hypothetical protein GOP47_0014733 [Adiantum capillus-veneris]|uniref:KNTC1 first ARM-repeats domain-containing protein n=1 Tax=Adiantum capillus-veneris TaxID=13818 RepID=A0A9D4ZEH4_ADICA|nr:hypothetical protein GOP47_0014733 [Adiantum capillus-veneris]
MIRAEELSMADPGIPSSSKEQPSHSYPRVLRLSRHASVTPQPLPDQIPSPPATWTGRFLSGLAQWWGNQEQSSGVQPSRALVVSAANTDIAIIDDYHITFLSIANGFEHAIQSRAGHAEDGFYTCGVWLEDSGFLAAMTRLNGMVMMDRSGKEVSRVPSGCWKTSAYALAIFAKQMKNTAGGEWYKLVIFASDCSIYQIEYGPKGFGELCSSPVSHASMKKIHPQGVTCHVYNCAKSFLALAGSSGSKSPRSAGTCCVSLWKVQDFWQSVEPLGYVDDIQIESSLGVGSFKAVSNVSMKLIMSPSCSYIGLLDAGTELHLVKVKQVPNGKLEKLNLHDGVKHGSRDEGRLQELKYPYFEVTSDNGISKGTDYENPLGIEEACWWDDTTLFLLKADGVLVIASIPYLQTVSRFHSGILKGGMYMTYGSQRCIYVLETILDEEQQSTVRTGSVIEARRGGWRLLRMQEHTVLQLFKALLANSEFDFALDVANRYNLEVDTVYKSQWLCSDWNLKSVQQILSKVKDTTWVLSECLQRVCPSMEAMDGLLRHGLHLVDSVVGPKSLKHAAYDPAVGQLCLSRLRLLQFGDRLETYLGLSMDRYSPKDYEVFRLSPLVDVALRLAESGKTGAVSLLYKRHVYSLTPFLLKILDAFPETLSPQSYAHLLPSLSPFTPYIVGRERDWIEEDSIIDILKKYNGDCGESDAVKLADSTEHVVKALIGFVWPSEIEIIEWYKRRVSTIDRLSGQLENALTLLDLGKQKGISGLEDLWEDLSSLHWVTYNISEADEGTEINWNLEAWQLLTDYEKFQAMLKGVTETNVLDRLNEKAIPFLNQKMRRIPIENEVQEHPFLVKWMKEMAAKDQLHICAIILTEACKDIRSNSLFKSELECINAGLECVYTCPGTDQWDTMEKILTKLSQSCSQLQANNLEDRGSTLKQIGRGASRVSPFSMYTRSTENTLKSDTGVASAKENVYVPLDRKIQKALGHVDAGRLLFNYQVPKPIAFLENAQSDERVVKQLILSMLSKFARRQPARSDAEWATMWDHLQRLQAKAFTFLNRQFLFMEYYSSLLKAGKFTLAKSQLKALGNNLLSPEKIETVIIQVSRDYLFSASTLDSLEIEKSRLCLNLVPESKNIASELDYIETVTKRLPALGVSMLPLQVKQTKDPMDIVRKSLIGSSSEGELQVDDVLDIAKSLGLNSGDQIDEVKEAIARQAAASGQIGLALHLCHGLMRRGHKAVWELCAALARGPELEEINLQLRKELLGFAISYCDDSSISQLLLTWKELDFSERCIYVKEAMDIGPSGGNTIVEGSSLEADLQQSDDLLPDLKKLLSEVAHLEGNVSLRVQKSLLRILCSHLPWLLQAANLWKLEKVEHGDMDLLVKAIATLLLGLAHNNLCARDELICQLAHVALSRFSRAEDFIGLGYLLNLSDNSRATDFLEGEIHHGEDLKNTCKILSLAFKYGSLQQKGMVGSSESPRARRERLLAVLRESDHSTVSEIIAEDGSGSKDVSWSQWQSKILKDLNAAQYSLELAPVVANFNLDQFMKGDQEYMKEVIKVLIKSSATPESTELDQTSRVDQYQSSNGSICYMEERAQSHRLNMLVLESNYKIFEKYMKHLDAIERWVFIQTLMTETAKVILEETGECCEDECRTKLCSLVDFWVIVLNSFNEESSSNDLSRKAKRASELRVCCESFGKLVLNNTLSGSLCREVIAQVVEAPSSEEERIRFLSAMVASGCAFQTVVVVWQHASESMRDDVFGHDFTTEISSIYVQIVSVTIHRCSVSSQSVSFDECFHQLDAMLKAVASLSKDHGFNDDGLLVPLREVRLCVWKTICDSAENLDIPSPLRVSLHKLREAIVSGHQRKGAFHGFDGHLRNFSIMWVGWDMMGLTGERTPPLQHTITALKSTELLSTAWQDLVFNAEDLDSVEAATAVFNELTMKVVHVQHACLLIRLLEGWGDIFGWEGNADEKETTIKEKAELVNAGWGDADGWDNVWDDSEEVIESGELEERVTRAVNALHACWKTALAKLASFREKELLLQALDRVHLRNGRTVLTREECLELVTFLAEEDPASALKVSLLLPYDDCQDLALESFDSKIRSTLSHKDDDGVSGRDDNERKQVLAVDECLLVLVLGAGRFSAWAEERKFAVLFCILSGLFSSMIQKGQFSSPFIRDTVFPYFLASLTPTSKYRVALALALQPMRMHPAFITWNSAYVSLRKFLEVKASMPFQIEESNTSSLTLENLSCISNSVHYLQSQLHKRLNSALQFLSNTSL